MSTVSYYKWKVETLVVVLTSRKVTKREPDTIYRPSMDNLSKHTYKFHAMVPIA
uniref:Uncharacterized protein n=1 Tax=Arion vulgaris TaxID=1028688 RepID=A0A0B7BE78_9EUPU